MPHPDIAAIAFFSLGVNVLGAVLLPMFNPRDRGVRWWAVFILTLAAWMLVEGLAASTGESAQWRMARAIVVHLLPASFLAFALVRGYDVRWRWLLVLLAVALATMPITLRARYSPPALTWQIALWLTGSALLWRSRRAYFAGGVATRFGRAMLVMTAVAFPVAAVAGLLLVGDQFFLYAMPLALVGMQALIFVGVIRVQLGDIEVRVARSSELLEEAARRERFAVVGEIAAAIAHEVRNPLAGVRSLAQRVAEDELDAARRHRYAGVIVEEVERVDRIITDLLGFARRHGVPDRPAAVASVSTLLEDLEMLTASRAERAGVSLHLDAPRVTRLAPREPLAQVLLNLMLNAIQASPPGGRVEVTATENADEIEFLVRDQGPGIAASEREQIFKPFYSATGGSGLGLAVVHRVVEENEWRLDVRDAPGGGAEFWLHVPSASSNGH